MCNYITELLKRENTMIANSWNSQNYKTKQVENKKEKLKKYLSEGGTIEKLDKINVTVIKHTKPKGQQIPLQGFGCLRVPGYAV